MKTRTIIVIYSFLQEEICDEDNKKEFRPIITCMEKYNKKLTKKAIYQIYLMQGYSKYAYRVMHLFFP